MPWVSKPSMNSTAMHRNSTRYWKPPIFCCSIMAERSIVCAATPSGPVVPCANAMVFPFFVRGCIARLLLVGDFGRDLVQLFAAVGRHDDRPADVDAMLAE